MQPLELEVKGCGVVQSLSSDRLAVDETLISQSCEQNRERRGGGSISLSRGVQLTFMCLLLVTAPCTAYFPNGSGCED